MPETEKAQPFAEASAAMAAFARDVVPLFARTPLAVLLRIGVVMGLLIAVAPIAMAVGEGPGDVPWQDVAFLAWAGIALSLGCVFALVWLVRIGAQSFERLARGTNAPSGSDVTTDAPAPPAQQAG